MTVDGTPGPVWAPESCTLPTAEQPLRLAEFDELFAMVEHGDRVSPQHLRLTLAGPAGLAETVRDLARRESACCSFFAFTVTAPQPGQVVFEIEVPTAHIDVLASLAARALPARGSR